LPNVVQIQGYDRYFKGELLEDSDSLKSLVAKYSKSQDFKTQKTEVSREFADSEAAKTQSSKSWKKSGSLDPYEDGGFGEVNETSNESKNTQKSDQNLAFPGEYFKSILPVKVAIIDSGVVASTIPIRSNLIQSVNLTNSLNVFRWRDHGTAIASLFSGTEQKGMPFKSYAANGRLVSIKIAFSGDVLNEKNPIDSMLQLSVALDQAISAGAKVVNMSFSYVGEVPAEIRLLESALIARGAQLGVIFVSAAGNEAVSLDLNPAFPARYDLQNLIVVGNHGRDHLRSYFSNYGNSVDLTAYGESVPLNTVEAGLELFSGTSFSAPMVAAAIVQSMGICSELDWHERLVLLRKTSIPSNDNSSRFGRLQAQRFWEATERTSVRFRGRSNRLPQLTKQQLDPNQ
jgi:Subtilase family